MNNKCYFPFPNRQVHDPRRAERGDGQSVRKLPQQAGPVAPPDQESPDEEGAAVHQELGERAHPDRPAQAVRLLGQGTLLQGARQAGPDPQPVQEGRSRLSGRVSPISTLRVVLK